jgi:hypothetical protein
MAPMALARLSERYEILKELGAGGMGRVFQARDRETGDMLALKILRSEIAADPAMSERFKNELRLARRITHKNVCRIYDFNRIDGLAYITMERRRTWRRSRCKANAWTGVRISTPSGSCCTNASPADVPSVGPRR